MKKSKLATALGFVSVALLSGCNGSSSSDDPSVTSYSVTAIDGYLRNATVWLDIDGDYQLDANEPSATSGNGGVASLDVTGITNPEQYKVVVQTSSNTIDEDTITVATPNGETLAERGEQPYVLSAPAGQKNITPLTTKVDMVLEKKKAAVSTTLTEEQIEVLKQEAVAEVADDYGIDANSVLVDFVSAGDAYAAHAAQRLVESKVLPQESKEMQVVVETIKESATDSSVTSLLDDISAADTIIKQEVQAAEAADELQKQSGSDTEQKTIAELLEEHKAADSDGDGVVDELDAFSDDATEWRDTDDDGTGDNADTDDDGDGIADTDDDFPKNKLEWVDTDNDGKGNNADTDDDNDGVADVDDAFPLDASESADSDDDGIGDNADTDTDNGDSSDTGSTVNTAIQFVLGQEAIYGIYTYDWDEMYVEPMPVSDNKAVRSGQQLVNLNGSLTDVTGETDGDDLMLTSSGWTSDTGMTLDFSDPENVVAYPTNIETQTYSLTLEWVDLSGVPFSEDSELEFSSGQFPSGSQAVKFTPVPQQDTYGLWLDSNFHINGNEVTSLDTMIAENSDATDQLFYFGNNIAFKLVDGGNVYYYTMSNGSANEVATGSWERSTLSSEDIIKFTVPQSALTAFGDSWDDDSTTIILSVYNGIVHRGSYEAAGQVMEEMVYLYNETAKNAIVSQQVIEMANGSDSSGDSSDSGSSDSDSGSSDTDSGSGTGTDTGTDSGDSSSDSSATGDEGYGIADGVGTITGLNASDAIAFLGNDSVWSEFDEVYEESEHFLAVLEFTVNGQIMASEGYKVVQPDNTLLSVDGGGSDLYLTDSGWKEIADATMTVDLSGTEAIAYSTEYSEFKYSLGLPESIDLSDVAISADTLLFWPDYQSDSATFPTGSQAITFTPVAQQDIYGLSSEWAVYVGGNQVATSLDQLVVSSPIESSNESEMNLVYLGDRIGVQLIDDGTTRTAKYYDMHDSTDLVGTSTWEAETKSGVELYRLTVPADVIATFGDAWEGDSNTLWFTKYNGQVCRGYVDLEGVNAGERVVFFNTTAAEAIVEQVSIPAANQSFWIIGYN